MGKGLKYVQVNIDDEIMDFVWGNGRILGLFRGGFEQFTDYAFGGKKVNNYRFYKEDGTPLTSKQFSEWQIIEDADIKDEYKSNLYDDVLLVKSINDNRWYFLFSNGELIEEDYVWWEE